MSFNRSPKTLLQNDQRELLEKEFINKISYSSITRKGFFKRAPIYEDDLVVRELRLFRAVLDKALLDYIGPYEEERKETEEWLSLDNDDFLLVCEYAFLDPEIVFDTFYLIKDIVEKSTAHDLYRNERSKSYYFKRPPKG